MILIHQISNSDLEYCDDIKECLNHNLANPIIRKIVIFSSCIDIEKKIGMDLKSRKLLLLKFDMSIFDMMNYGKKNSKDFVIYGAPFIKFDVDLINTLNFDFKKVLKDDYSYYIFDRNLKIKNERDIDDVLLGEKIKIFLKTKKLGYYKYSDFQSISYGWRVSKNIQKPDTPKITPKIDTPKIYTPLVDIPKKIIKKPKKNKYNTRKIDVVIVSVNYNDFLLISLENNSKIFENITVITSSNDFLCQKICEKFKVKCIVTDVMYEDGALFNKGKAINEAIKSITDPDYILLLDADIVVIDKVDVDSLEDDVFYTSDRYMVNNFDSYQSYISGDLDKDSFLLDDDKGYGFFQLFNYVQDIKYPEFSNDASTDDIIFRDSFDLRKSIKKTILHLGEDSNWKGRCSKSFLSYEQFNNLLEKEFTTIPKTFKICTFYYNPQKDVRREENFLKFLAQFEGYQDNMLIGLVDYDGDLDIPDHLKDNILVIKGDKENPIWYKETLMNKMIDIVDTDYIIWIDNDLIYENHEWLKNINSIVRGKDFVQLYKNINYLGEDGEILESHRSILSSDRSDIDTLLGEGYKPGGSWIGKTSILKDTKFFEKMYVGGGDTIFLYGLFGIVDGYTLNLVKESNEYIWKEAVEWIKSNKKYRLGYLDVSINHLYHGDLKDRNYDGRYKKLSSFIEKNLNKKSRIEIRNSSVLDKGLINRTFDKVYCLNLDRRMDRWESMQEKLKYLGIEAKRFSAVDGDKIDSKILSKYSINKYAVGCIFSHYEIIKDAKLNNYQKILIIEDDVLFSDNFLEDFERKINILDNWKIIYLGCSQYDWDVDIVDGFYNSKKSLGTFAYAIDQCLYDEILNTDSIKDTPIDNILSIIQNKYYDECYSFFPNIIIADVSESDIRGSRVMIEHSKKMRWEMDKFKNFKPFFSIIIPTYNSKYLIETLDSVQSQTIDDYECIVIDDGSIDDLSEIENLYKNTKVYKRPDYLNKNANSCRNYGVYMSKGKYIIFLDSDDILSSNCLENRKSKILENMLCSLHIFKMGRFRKNINDMNQLVNKKPSKDKIVDDFLSYNILWPITAPTWKREDIYKIGGFDENLNRFQDFDIHIRFLLSNDNYIIYDDVDIDCYYRNSEFHTNLTEGRKRVIIESAEYLINKYKEYGVNFNVEFFQYLKKRYNYEDIIHQL